MEEKLTENTHVDRLSAEEIKNLALGIIHGEVFTDRHVPGHMTGMMSMLFMPLAFSNDIDWIVENVGTIYAYYKDALPRAINGFPVFMTMGLVVKDDSALLWDMVSEMRKALDSIGVK